MSERDSERLARLQRWLAAMPPTERLSLIGRYAQRMHVSAEEADDMIRKIESGEADAELESLEAELAPMEAELARLRAEVQRLQHLASIHVPHDRPWMMAIEMQFAALRLMHSIASSPEGEAVGRGLALSQIALLKRAESYAWSADPAAAAWLAARTVPPDSVATPSLLPGSAGWWWFEKPIPIRTTNDTDGLQALLWATTDRGVEFGAYVTDPKHGGPILSLSWVWPHDMSWASMTDAMHRQEFLLLRSTDIPSEAGHTAIGQASRFFIAGCAWLYQRVVTMTAGHVERHRRKQFAREQADALVQSEVRVIQLRRAEATHGHAGAAADGEPVEWSCRWIVSGHWRNQYYPSLGERKLIYIMPFVKGPVDKPLKTATHTVYEVSR